MAKPKLGAIAVDRPAKLPMDLPSKYSSGPRRLRRPMLISAKFPSIVSLSLSSQMSWQSRLPAGLLS
jgi:hypothetical protein